MRTVRVLIVDDSSFIRRRLAEILSAGEGIEVIGSASNGKEAINFVEKFRPDVVTMDIEMPVMDGITAVRIIMKECPTPVLMFSAMTTEGAKATLDALDAGAADFLPKTLTHISENTEIAKARLCEKVRALGAYDHARSRPTRLVFDTRTRLDTHEKIKAHVKPITDYDMILIGASTGGPAALQLILASMPAARLPPIVIVQHMPESFTGAYARRLDGLCKNHVCLAEDGQLMHQGTIYLAPGGHQLTFLPDVQRRPKIRIKRADDSMLYKPCIDLTFKSAAELNIGKILAIIMTGMGSDGREGSRALRSRGATIIAQDQASSDIYGMPMAIAKAGLADVQLSLVEIAILISGN